jgi:hypothetical protein
MHPWKPQVVQVPVQSSQIMESQVGQVRLVCRRHISQRVGGLMWCRGCCRCWWWCRLWVGVGVGISGGGDGLVVLAGLVEALVLGVKVAESGLA